MIAQEVTDVKHEMTHDRGTKGTEVYKGEAPIKSLYIDKAAFGGKEVPAKITVDIKEIK